MLHSDSYDLDQVYREIDGVAQAAAFHAFNKLAELETVLGNDARKKEAESIASHLADGVQKHFWSDDVGYYYEHLIYNDIARSDRLGTILEVSSELDEEYSASKAIDSIVGIGIDAFQVGIGAAGKHEWATKGETTGAWIRVGLSEPTEIDRVILFNRTDPSVRDSEKFAAGYLGIQ